MTKTFSKEFDKFLNKLKSGENIHSFKLPTLGFCELRVKVSEGLPKRICYLREGMKIYNNTTKFEDRAALENVL